VIGAARQAATDANLAARSALMARLDFGSGYTLCP